jgi:hypothetical protein
MDRRLRLCFVESYQWDVLDGVKAELRERERFDDGDGVGTVHRTEALVG